MHVSEELFPSERRLEYVQTEWAKGWAAGAAGFGYAAEFLTKHARSFGATIDQAGLAVFFLQRHRVEMVLKDLLVSFGIEFKPSHSLQYLWGLCQQGFASKAGLDWASFEKENGDFIKALIKTDDGATTFRFPVDQDGETIERPKFIDLEALNRHADKFDSEISGCMDFVSEGAAEMKAAEADYGGEEEMDWEDL